MKDIYSFIRSQEQNFKLPIQITDNYDWNFPEHVNLTVLYKNSTFKTGKNGNKPFKNITRPILSLQYRAEGFDVKDITLFIEDAYNYYKSFLVKKYHEVWARKNKIDTFIDELVESYVDFGGALIKNVGGVRPEVVPLQRLAFCDQTDLLSGPICEKHYYSSEELRAEGAERGWENIDDVIVLAGESKDVGEGAKKVSTPSKYIEVYELHGIFPKYCLYDTKDGRYTGQYYDPKDKDSEDVRQLHICTFYQTEKGDRKGITLYKGTEKELPYKLLLRDEIYGRALGLGGAEELFEPQVWTNYGQIRMKDLLDAASKIILKTTDPSIAARHPGGLKNVDNLEILEIENGRDIGQIDTRPVNYELFRSSVQDWEQHARQMGAATESIMGESPTSGTPFKLQELITAESHSLHEYRKGKIATFLDELYRDWFMPHISREITNGKTFLSELDVDELQQIGDRVVECKANEFIKEKILNGQVIEPTEVDAYKQQVRTSFARDNQKFIEILKGELKNVPLSVKVNIAGKQKNLASMTDKLVNIFRTVISNPQILQSPPMAKLFNTILESSGLSPLDFTGFTIPTQAPAQPPTSAGTAPLQQLSKGQPMMPQMQT